MIAKAKTNTNIQISKNLFANILYFIISIGTSLFLTPFYISSLGISAYALIPLATSITSYIGLITQSLNSSISRHLTIDLQTKDVNDTNITFNTALFGMLFVIILILPLVLLLVYYIPDFFNVPLEQKMDSLFLFAGIFAAFLIRTFKSIFETTLFASNRLDIQKYINIIYLALQFSTILFLFLLFSPELKYVGISYLFSAIIVFIISKKLLKRISPYIIFNFHLFSKSRFKDLMGTTNWIIVNQIGDLLFLQIDLILVNKIFGNVAGGEYAIIITIASLIRAIVGILAGLLTPIIFTHYAKKQIKEMINTSKISIKFLGLAIALPLGFICGFAPTILSLWVGPEFIKMTPMVWLQLFHLCINLSVLPLFPVNISFDKVKIPGIITFVAGIFNIVFAVGLAYYSNFGYYGIALAAAITLTLRNGLFIPFYASKILNVKMYEFIKPIIPGILYTILISFASYLICDIFNIIELITLVLSGIFISLTYVMIVWKVSLDNSEKRIISSFIPENILHIVKL